MMSLNSDMDKKLERLRRSRKYYQARVDEAAKKKMGSREWAKRKALKKQQHKPDCRIKAWLEGE